MGGGNKGHVDTDARVWWSADIWVPQAQGGHCQTQAASPSDCEATVRAPPICTQVLCLVRTHCTGSLRVMASLTLWTSPSQEEAGNSVAGGCRSHGGGPCQKGLPGGGQAPTAARARGHPVAWWEGALRWTGSSTASTRACTAGGGTTRSLRRCRAPGRGGPGPQRPAPRAQAHLRGERREPADPPEGEQEPEGYVALGTGAGAPGDPVPRARLPHAQKPQHRHGLARVLTLPF